MAAEITGTALRPADPERVALLTADYFTDPLCSWSWGNEPSYRKLLVEFGDQIEWRHRMGGLIESWEEAPAGVRYELGGTLGREMHEHWREVARETQSPIDAGLWQSSGEIAPLLAPLAVKAAELQGFEVADRLLRRLREAYLCEQNTLAAPRALLDLARELPGLELARFELDLAGGRVRAAFQADFELARNPLPEARDTKRSGDRIRYSYPSLVLASGSEILVLDADHTPRQYLEAVQRLAPAARRSGPPGVAELVERFPTLTTNEVVVIAELPRAAARSELRALVKSGRLTERRVGHRSIWIRRQA